MLRPTNNAQIFDLRARPIITATQASLTDGAQQPTPAQETASPSGFHARPPVFFLHTNRPSLHLQAGHHASTSSSTISPSSLYLDYNHARPKEPHPMHTYCLLFLTAPTSEKQAQLSATVSTSMSSAQVLLKPRHALAGCFFAHLHVSSINL